MVFHLTEIEEILGYKFNNPEILRRCFVHPSYANEHNEESYDRLEFLGDSILGYVVADYLYNSNKQSEGDMTLRKQALVSREPLSMAIKKLGLNSYVLASESLMNNITDSVSENLYEALVAGIYLDGGLENAKAFIYKTLIDVVVKNAKQNYKKVVLQNYKNTLKEYCEKKKLGSLEYVLIKKSGNDHNPIFEMAVKLGGKQLAKGRGKSKKIAEQEASCKALEILNKNKKNGKSKKC